MAGFEPWSYGVGRQQLCHLWHNICPRLENLFRSWNFFIVVNGQKLNHLFTPRLDYPYLLPTQQALTRFIKTTSFAKKDWESNCTGLLLWWHTLWSVPPRISFSLLNLISFQVKFGPNWRVSDSWGVPALPYLTFTGTNLIFKNTMWHLSHFVAGLLEKCFLSTAVKANTNTLKWLLLLFSKMQTITKSNGVKG